MMVFKLLLSFNQKTNVNLAKLQVDISQLIHYPKDRLRRKHE